MRGKLIERMGAACTLRCVDEIIDYHRHMQHRIVRRWRLHHRSSVRVEVLRKNQYSCITQLYPLDTVLPRGSNTQNDRKSNSHRSWLLVELETCPPGTAIATSWLAETLIECSTVHMICVIELRLPWSHTNITCLTLFHTIQTSIQMFALPYRKGLTTSRTSMSTAEMTWFASSFGQTNQ